MKYEITKYQIEKLADEDSIVKDCLKEWFPEVFKTELEVGKWYKNSKSIFCYTETSKTGALFGYGFHDGKWFNHSGHICACNAYSKKHLIEATPEEVESALINYLEKQL